MRTRSVVTRFLAKRLGSSGHISTMAESVACQRRAFGRATVVIRVYYALGVYFAVQSIARWPGYAGLETADPLWPAHWWFDRVGVRAGVNIIFSLYLVAAVLVMLLPERRWARATYAFALLQYMALLNSFDKVNHNLHSWLFVSIVLILLPRGPWNGQHRVADRQYFLTVVWTALLFVLFFYTLSGVWKIHDAVTGVIDGRINGLNFSGFSYIVANRLLVTNQGTVLGPFFVNNEIPGWALFVGTMYLEASSVIIAFRPRLHRLWGLGLIAFHVGTQLAMGFTFPENIVLVGLFLVFSPWTPDRIGVRDALLDLPLVHFTSRRLGYLRRRHAHGLLTVR
jgi:hypothetical protein